MRTIPALLVALALLAGCASSSPSEGWTKPGMTEEQLARDRMDCLAEARSMTGGLGGPQMKVDYPRYQRCMSARGYSGTAAN